MKHIATILPDVLRTIERRARETITMPMQRDLYPDDWDDLAHAIKEAAGWRCTGCDRQCYRPGEPVEDNRRVLQVAHIDHDPSNCHPSNLRALCSVCHLQYDMATRRAVSRPNFFDWKQGRML